MNNVSVKGNNQHFDEKFMIGKNQSSKNKFYPDLNEPEFEETVNNNKILTQHEIDVIQIRQIGEKYRNIFPKHTIFLKGPSPI